MRIGRYEGVVCQRHPDGFVALFGAPGVHEDDARRAILAALAIQHRSHELVSGDGFTTDRGLQRLLATPTRRAFVCRLASTQARW